MLVQALILLLRCVLLVLIQMLDSRIAPHVAQTAQNA